MKQIAINNISTTYYITEDGRCFNEKTGKFLKGQVNCKNGYISFMITLPDGSKKRLYAHRLVALNYIPNPENKQQINHIDGDKLNNNVDNLEWATQEENQQHAIKIGLRTFSHVFCFSKDKVLVAEYKDIEEAAKACGISRGIIIQELDKQVKTLSGGFYWSRDSILGQTKDYKNLGKAKEVYQYDLNGKFIKSYSSGGEAARALGMSKCSHITECCRGKIKTYKGFVWRYKDDIVSPSVKTEESVSKTLQE